MYRFMELRSRLVATATFVLLASIMLVLATDAQEIANIPKMTTPQGVRLLTNKTFDDSHHALQVGKLAKEIHIGDEKSRAQRFKRFGIPLDDTVKVE